MNGMVRELTEQDALVGTWCGVCRRPLRIGERVIIKPSAPARHEQACESESHREWRNK
jgi:hypothetical protein